jgi:hypothetical protein
MHVRTRFAQWYRDTVRVSLHKAEVEGYLSIDRAGNVSAILALVRRFYCMQLISDFSAESQDADLKTLCIPKNGSRCFFFSEHDHSLLCCPFSS